MSYSRREFMQNSLIAMGLISITGTLISFLQSCAKSSPTEPNSGGNQQSGPVTLDLNQTANKALLNVGGTLALGANSLDSQGILLVRASTSELRAFSRKCTHQGCTIGAFSSGISTCPCHGSKFNTNGGVVNGPASASLRQYSTQLDNTTLTISA